MKLLVFLLACGTMPAHSLCAMHMMQKNKKVAMVSAPVKSLQRLIVENLIERTGFTERIAFIHDAANPSSNLLSYMSQLNQNLTDDMKLITLDYVISSSDTLLLRALTLGGFIPEIYFPFIIRRIRAHYMPSNWQSLKNRQAWYLIQDLNKRIYERSQNNNQ